MLVDPALLRSFANQVDAASTDLKAIESGLHDVRWAADGLPGSETQWAMRAIGEHVWLAAEKIASQVETMGVAVRGAGDRYEVDDDALAGAFKGLF